MRAQNPKNVAVMATLAVIVLASCQRDQVNLDRPCANDGDCVAGAICISGRCSGSADPNCVPSEEICDGRDNDCDGNADEDFECVLSGSESCNDGTSRLCKSDCTYSGCVQNWLDGAWPVRTTVTINGSLVAAQVGDVPVPVRIPPALFDSTFPQTADGRDVRFTSSAGERLDHQVESWDATRGYLVWVRVPNLEAGESRQLTMYLGNAFAEPSAGTGVWDEGYAGVWHMGEDTDENELRDATGGDRRGERSAASPSVGVFASGQHFNGSQGAWASKASIPANSDFTLEAWVTTSGGGQPYRRALSLDTPAADMQARWDIPGSVEFRAHSDDYEALRVVEGEEARTYAVLLTDHGGELWVRAPEFGPKQYDLVYGQLGISDDSSPPDTFDFWAQGASWNQFTGSATASIVGPELVFDGGRLAATVPFDMRSGYFVQTYAKFSQMGGETRSSGGLPHISSSATPNAGLNPAVAGVFIQRAAGIGGSGALRTSAGAATGFDQTSNIDISLLDKDVGVGTFSNTATIFVDQAQVRQVASAWAQPLTHLLVGNYDGSATMFRTIYVAMFVRKWLGATPTITSSRERVGGVGIGDFAIGVQPDRMFASTNANVDFVFDGSGPLATTHHVALVVEGATATFYVDGVNRITLPVSAHGELRGLSLADAFAVNGVVDEVRLSTTARKAAVLAFQVQTARSDLVAFGPLERLE